MQPTHFSYKWLTLISQLVARTRTYTQIHTEFRFSVVCIPFAIVAEQAVLHSSASIVLV